MPAAGLLIAAAINVAGYGLTAFIAGTAFSWATAGLIFAATAVLGVVNQALAKRNSLDSLGSGPRTLTIRDPAAPRRVVLGDARVGGVIVYMTTTDNDKDLHLVLALCDGPVTAIDAVWLDDTPILDSDLDSNGWVVTGPFAGTQTGFAGGSTEFNRGAFGRFSGACRIRKHLGTAPQTADANLVAAVTEWTSEHRLDGIAYLYLTLRRDDAAFPSGIPNISADVRGLAIYDPRDAGTRFTRNAALMQRYWLASGRWGLGDASIDDTALSAAANLAEESVPVTQASDTFIAKFASDTLRLVTTTAPLTESAARAVTLTTTGTLPAPLQTGTTYYAIIAGSAPGSFMLAASAEDAKARAQIVLTNTGTGTHTLHCSVTRYVKDEGQVTTNYSDEFTAQATAGRMLRQTRAIGWRRGDTVRVSTTGTLPAGLAAATDYYIIPDARDGFRIGATYADAMSDTAVSVTDAGSGTHTITRTAEARYAGGGVIDASIDRKTTFEALLSASGGRAIWTGGVWKVSGAAAGSSVLTLAEVDLRGPIKVRTRAPRRDRFNAVEGLFHSPDARGQPVSYPKVASAAFKAADNDEELIRNIDFGWTDSPATCQRLAKIELLRARQEIEFSTTASLKALNLAAGDWLSATNTRFGWAAKLFECTQWQLSVEGNPPALTVALSCHEVAATDYDWSTSEEQTVDPAPNTNLPSPWALAVPSGLAVTETLYETRDGAGVKARATLSWDASTDGFVTSGGGYEIEYRTTAQTAWTQAGRVTAASIDIDDIAPNIYEFRVRSYGRLNQTSGWSSILEYEITGLLASPADIAGLTIQTISAVAILTWTRHPDLDVRIGGRIRVRWSPVTSGATWQASTEVCDPVPGDATQAIVPLRDGTYLVRAFDSSGIPSANAVLIPTRAAEHLTFATVATITESPTFTGTHSGTISIDNMLKLSAAGLFDAIPDLDAAASIDSYGGIVATGTYTFAGGIDLGTVQTVRLTAGVTASAVNVLDKIDDRAARIDTWDDFDGTTAADADMQVWFRETDDNPAGTPVWTDWLKLTAGDRNARGFEFKAVLTTTDPAYNIHCTALSVTAEQ